MNLITQGRKVTRQNTFPFDTFVISRLLTFLLCTSFGASLLHFFVSIDLPFTSHSLILLQLSNCTPLNLSHCLFHMRRYCNLGKLRVLYRRIIFKGGLRFFICLLMNELTFCLNKVLGYMHMHITWVGLKGTNFPRVAYIISYWLCCL